MKTSTILVSTLLSVSPLSSAIVIANDDNILPPCEKNPNREKQGCFGKKNLGNDDVYIGEIRNGKPNGDGTLISSDGIKYYGNFKNGERDGYGLLLLENRNFYIGQWKSGSYSGSGFRFYGNSTIYSGGFKWGDYHGDGLTIREDGSSLRTSWWFGKPESTQQEKNDECDSDGTHPEFKDTKPCFGTRYLRDSEQYVGFLLKSQFEGIGRHRLPSGDIYFGSFKAGLRHGDGVMVWQSGEIYAGSWADGERTGDGLYLSADGERYVGRYLSGKRHGRGKLFSADGTIQKFGEWECGTFKASDESDFSFELPNSPNATSPVNRNGVPLCTASGAQPTNRLFPEERTDDGEAIHTDTGSLISEDKISGDRCFATVSLASGSSYSGTLLDEKFDGVGVLRNRDGSYYDGEWARGLKEGVGKLVTSRCEVYQGQFKNDRFNGMGKYIFSWGDRYVGHFINDSRTGEGIYYYSDGSKYEGAFVNGKADGFGTLTAPDGTTKTGMWSNSKFLGTMEELKQAELEKKAEAAEKERLTAIARTAGYVTRKENLSTQASSQLDPWQVTRLIRCQVVWGKALNIIGSDELFSLIRRTPKRHQDVLEKSGVSSTTRTWRDLYAAMRDDVEQGLILNRHDRATFIRTNISRCISSEYTGLND